MREIKFRSWDKITKQYYEVKGLEYDDDGNLDEVYLAGLKVSESNPVFNLRKPSDVILEQSTGLKDSNGKEIYEGDIVLDYYDGDDAFIVEWDNDTAGFRLTDTNNIISVSFDNFYPDKDLLVIGNINENQELLKEKE